MLYYSIIIISASHPTPFPLPNRLAVVGSVLATHAETPATRPPPGTLKHVNVPRGHPLHFA